MYYKLRRDVLFRNYGCFGFITDNRDWEYRKIGDETCYIGDKVVSQSGAVFLSVLEKRPHLLDDLVQRVAAYFEDADASTVRKDVIDFYDMLEEDGFVVSGLTEQECNENDNRLLHSGLKTSQKRILSPLDYNTSQDFFAKYFDGEAQLLSLHIEITSTCNERCVHCYISNEQKVNSMSPELFYAILEQARAMNLLHLTISGGEPMQHSSFIDFLKKCKSLDFSVSVLSNLTLLDKDILMELRDNPLLGVQTSLYSMDARIHDSITKVKGSFEKTKNAILRLTENDIPLQINCPILKQNLGSYKDVIEWGNSLNVNVSSNFAIIAEYNHTNGNLNNRLTINEVAKVIADKIDNERDFFASLKKEVCSRKEKSIDDPVCPICSISMCVSEEGNVFPCVGWKNYTLGNVGEISLKDIWHNSEKLKYLKGLCIRDFPKCTVCSKREFCNMCMARNSNESPSGDIFTPSEYFCDIAQVTKVRYSAHKDSESLL